jgi:NAD(P)-dependent dehydrogenase (short-subunit alcohol dehydrogenase family)
MDMGLAGKVAAITCGANGIGRAAAFRLAEEGARVAICSRHDEVVKTTALEIQAAIGVEVLAITADGTDPAAYERFILASVTRFRRLDILIHDVSRSADRTCAPNNEVVGSEPRRAPVMPTDWCMRLVVPYMRQQGSGRIIHLIPLSDTVVKAVSDPRISTGMMPESAYRPDKVLTQECAAENILVNTICLGWLKGERWRRRWQDHQTDLTLDEFYAKEGEAIPLKRLGEPEDVADLICFLASERARYITGTTITVDGGLFGMV